MVLGGFQALLGRLYNDVVLGSIYDCLKQSLKAPKKGMLRRWNLLFLGGIEISVYLAAGLDQKPPTGKSWQRARLVADNRFRIGKRVG